MTTQERIDSSRLVYADILRTIACFAVIFIHVTGANLGTVSFASLDWYILLFYDALVRWCVPIFVMLSGMFLLDLNKNVSIKDVFLKYIPRVLVALLIWGSFYALLDYGHTSMQFSLVGIKDAFLHVMNANTHYHLWYLYVIIGLYLITPILRAFLQGASKAQLHYFFALAFVFTSLLPLLKAVFPQLLAVPIAWLNRLDIHLVLGYVGYYVAGFYLKSYPLEKKTRIIIYILGLLNLAITFFGTLFLSLQQGIYIDHLFGYFSPNVVLSAIALFVYIKYKHNNTEKNYKLIPLIAKHSFHIYLSHDFFIMLFRHFGISSLSFFPLLSVPLLSLLILIFSLVVSICISKIPVVGKYLS